MKAYLLAGAALAMIAAPAAARDNSAYFGLEIGPMWLDNTDMELNGDEFIDIDNNLGVDGDLIAGYDFGIVRAEIEGGHKWAKWDEFRLIDEDGDSEAFDVSGHSRAYSIMANALIDLGNNETVNFYAGGGVGYAWLRASSDEDDLDDDIGVGDSNFAWQAIAGVRAPLFTYFDVGLKYRYFNGGRIDDEFDGDDVRVDKWRSHSVLASLIYNFAPPPGPPLPPPPPPLPPVPPAPEPPATQVCPDGSVILATDPCPMPPPPPPPPMPEPERG